MLITEFPLEGPDTITSTAAYLWNPRMGDNKLPLPNIQEFHDTLLELDSRCLLTHKDPAHPDVSSCSCSGYAPFRLAYQPPASNTFL
jgi:hypothetical protein